MPRSSLRSRSPGAIFDDGVVRMFATCDCRIGQSVPLVVFSEGIILRSEEYGRPFMEALRKDSGREVFTKGMAAGAEGAISNLTAEPARDPELGEESAALHLTFDLQGLGPASGDIGVVRIGDVVGLVGLIGLPGDIHEGDLRGLLAIVAARIRGEAPPPAPNPAEDRSPAPAEQTA